MKMRSTSITSLLLATGCALLLLAHSTQAAAYNWTAASGTTWATGWTGGNVPTTSDDLTILGPLNAAGTLNIDVAATAAAKTINVTDTSAVTLTNINSGADQTLTLQNGLTTGTGAVTIGSVTASQGVLIALGASQTWDIGAGGLTINNAISGTTFGITKSGSGTLTLNGTNTYTGPTSVTAGTLVIGATGAWSTNAGNTLTVDGGTFKFAGATALTVNQATTVGATGATFDGSGTTQGSSALTLGATNTTNSIVYSGTAASRTITLAGTYANGESVTNIFNYKITDDGTGGVTNLVKSGTGNWQLNAANTYSGTTSISGGVLSVGVTNALPTTTGLTFTANGTFNLVSGANQTIASLNSTFTGANIEDTNGGNGSTTGVLTVTGAGSYAGTISQRSSQFARAVSLTKSGTGTLTLTNNNTYAGGTQVTGGTLAITKANGLGTGVSGPIGATNTNITTVSGSGTLDLNGGTSAIVVNEAITLNGGNLVNNSTTNATTLDNGVAAILVSNKGAGGATAASISFSGSPTTAATGTVGVSSGLTSFLFTPGSGYTATPTITVTATTGSFTTTPTATAILSSLTLAGTGNTIGGPGNLAINAVVSGTGGGFAKTGNGTVTLKGANTYTGLTDVQAGTLSIGNAGGLAATGSVTVSGGTLTSSVANVNLGLGAVSMSSGAITPDGIGTAGSFTLAANQTFSTTGGTLNFDLVSSSSFDQIIGSGSGTFSLTGTTLALTGLTSVTGSYQIFSGFSSGSVSGLTITGLDSGLTGSIDTTGLLTVAAIPEPSSYAALAATAMLGFVACRRRRTDR